MSNCTDFLRSQLKGIESENCQLQLIIYDFFKPLSKSDQIT